MARWFVVVDASGHYRSLHMNTGDRGFSAGVEPVEECEDYLDACRKADDLNEVAEVMGS